MEAVVAALGIAAIGIVLLDAFETIVLPRRVTRQVRLTRVWFRSTWRPWSGVASRVPARARETYLSFYAPLFLIFLIVLWASLMVLGFAMVAWGLGSARTGTGTEAGFGSDVYLSGTTFFTLGIGDVAPDSSFSRALTVVEGGAGFGFLALVVTYVPVLYQSFSRREVNVSLLDARAGSPPSAGELFRRLDDSGRAGDLSDLLRDWERWAAELLESHLSYPVLTLYRSQHERQSWLGALTVMLDTSALVMAGGVEEAKPTARLTFAMARHAAVDLSQVLRTSPRMLHDRLPPADFDELMSLSRSLLGGVRREKLNELRLLYEPNLEALSRYLLMPIPGWLPDGTPDAWKSSPWGVE